MGLKEEEAFVYVCVWWGMSREEPSDLVLSFPFCPTFWSDTLSEPWYGSPIDIALANGPNVASENNV